MAFLSALWEQSTYQHKQAQRQIDLHSPYLSTTKHRCSINVLPKCLYFNLFYKDCVIQDCFCHLLVEQQLPRQTLIFLCNIQTNRMLWRSKVLNLPVSAVVLLVSYFPHEGNGCVHFMQESVSSSASSFFIVIPSCQEWLSVCQVVSFIKVIP